MTIWMYGYNHSIRMNQPIFSSARNRNLFLKYSFIGFRWEIFLFFKKMNKYNFRYAQTTRSLAEINLTYKVQIEDLGKRQSQEEEMIASRQSHNRNSKIYDLENYHTYEEVNLLAKLS